ncbi:MAG: ABC transporter ATP-binding protein [Desulfovibrionaceae bacterium]
MPTSFLAQLCKVEVRYGKRTVLNNICLNIAKGDFWTVIGPNGAGKSTFLGLFNGLSPVHSGTRLYHGEAVTRKNLARIRLDIAHVFQASDLDPKMPLSVFEAVLGGTYGRLGLFRRPGKAEKSLALWALEVVGLAHLAARPIGHLSGGERQRTALARALAQKPELLLLDEPTAALDWQAQREILQTIAKLRDTLKLTVIMVTHDLNAVFSLAQKVAMLQDGQLFWQGAVDEAMQEPLLSTLYKVPITIIRSAGRKAALF